MSPNLDASIVTASVHTIQALQFSENALNLVVQLYPSDPVRIALSLYENAVNSLISAFTTIQVLPFIQMSPSHSLNESTISCLQDTQLIIKLAENQTVMGLSKIRAAIIQIEQVILLIGNGDRDVLCQLVSIRTDLVSAQNALIAVLNMYMPP